MSKIPKIKVKNAVLYTIVHTVMIMLKLSGSVDWSWWWIFSPAWLLFVFMFIELTWMRYVTRRHEAIAKLSDAISNPNQKPALLMIEVIRRSTSTIRTETDLINSANRHEVEESKMRIRKLCAIIHDSINDYYNSEGPRGNNCETPNKKCFMNYCDENGCQDRIRTEAGPIHPQNT